MTEQQIKKILDDHIPQDMFFLFVATWTSFWCAVAVLHGFSDKSVNDFIRDGFIAIIARWPTPTKTEQETESNVKP